MSIITSEKVVCRKNANFLPKNTSMQNIQESIKYDPFGVKSHSIEGLMRTLCVFRTLSAYIKATRHIRLIDQLFVTFKKGDQGRGPVIVQFLRQILVVKHASNLV